MSSDTTAGDMVTGFIMLGIILGLYFLPAIIAAGRSHRQTVPIVVLDLLLGWTLIGWVGALIWSLTSPTPIVAPVVVTTAPATAAAIPQPSLRPCPYCAEPIQPAAKVCRFCNRDVEPVAG